MSVNKYLQALILKLGVQQTYLGTFLKHIIPDLTDIPPKPEFWDGATKGPVF